MERNHPDYWVQNFLKALARDGIVTHAAEAAGIDPSLAYAYKKQNADFAESWQIALEASTDVLEAAARQRAVEGVAKPVFYQGEECGSVTEYSDALLALLLKGHRKRVFADRTELTGADGGPVLLDDTARQARVAQIMAAAQARKDAAERDDDEFSDLA